jgi:hypothetical protein
MGNKLCKKKSDVVDNPKSPTPFDRIINRLHVSHLMVNVVSVTHLTGFHRL